MGAIIYSFYVNISPKMSHGVSVICYITELHAYDFVIKKALFVLDPVCIYSTVIK